MFTLKAKEELISAWDAYLIKLDKLKQEVQRRAQLNYALQDRMPPQRLILELASECMSLTKQQHGGEGNISCFYAVFREMCDIAEVTFYDYNLLVKLNSTDGFITCFDTDIKANLQKKYSENVLMPYLNRGGRWKGGRSAIDNTLLPNVMLASEFGAELRTLYLKNLVLRFIQKKQKNTLQAMSQNQSVEESLSCRLLRIYGGVLENPGQFPEETKDILWKMIQDRSKTTISEPNDIFVKFSKFTKEKPGEYFDGNVDNVEDPFFNALSPKQKHSLVQIAGLWSKKLKLKSRPAIEDQTPIRYITHLWKRKLPLTNIINSEEKVIRSPNTEENSRVRANQGAYMPSHGLSMSSSGYLEGLDNAKSLYYSWGMPTDPEASISNFHCDIEKIAREVVLLNPKGAALPGESYFTVGQNSLTGSSIKITQHTQISLGIIKDFKIYTLTSCPQWCEKINAELDCIQVGEKADAFYLKIVTAEPASDNLLECLNELKISLLRKFGGCEKIDFHVHMIPNGDGKFTIIFAPLTHLEVRENDIYVNPDSGESHVEQGLPVQHIHLGNGAGVFGIDFSQNQTMVAAIIEEGKRFLEKLYDFTAKTGSRDHVIDFLSQKIGFQPKVTTKCFFKHQ